MFVSVIGECWDEKGRHIRCPGVGLHLALWVALTVILCLLVTWATNRFVGSFSDKGRSAAWGVLAGFIFAALLLAALFGVFTVAAK